MRILNISTKALVQSHHPIGWATAEKQSCGLQFQHILTSPHDNGNFASVTKSQEIAWHDARGHFYLHSFVVTRWWDNHYAIILTARLATLAK